MLATNNLRISANRYQISSMDMDRALGILTRSDREYLLGEKEYKSNEAEINKRRDIRNRIKNGILDFELIDRYFPDKDRDKLFSEITDGTESEQHDFVDAVEALIAWLYVGLRKGGFNAKAIFERGIQRGESDFGISRSAKIVQSEVSLHINTREIEGVQQTIEKLEQGNPIMGHQLFPLIRNDVSADFSNVDKVRIWSDSGRANADKEIFETIFDVYFNTDIEIEVMTIDD